MLCAMDQPAYGAMWECPLLLELQGISDDLRPAGLGTSADPGLRSRSESYRYTESAWRQQPAVSGSYMHVIAWQIA